MHIYLKRNAAFFHSRAAFEEEYKSALSLWCTSKHLFIFNGSPTKVFMALSHCKKLLALKSDVFGFIKVNT